MLRAAVIFFMLAIFSILVGANGIAGVSLEIGRLLLFVFLALAVISVIAGLISGKPPRQLN